MKQRWIGAAVALLAAGMLSWALVSPRWIVVDTGAGRIEVGLRNVRVCADRSTLSPEQWAALSQLGTGGCVEVSMDMVAKMAPASRLTAINTLGWLTFGIGWLTVIALVGSGALAALGNRVVARVTPGRIALVCCAVLILVMLALLFVGLPGGAHSGGGATAGLASCVMGAVGAVFLHLWNLDRDGGTYQLVGLDLPKRSVKSSAMSLPGMLPEGVVMQAAPVKRAPTQPREIVLPDDPDLAPMPAVKSSTSTRPGVAAGVAAEPEALELLDEGVVPAKPARLVPRVEAPPPARALDERDSVAIPADLLAGVDLIAGAELYGADPPQVEPPPVVFRQPSNPSQLLPAARAVTRPSQLLPAVAPPQARATTVPPSTLPPTRLPPAPSGLHAVVTPRVPEPNPAEAVGHALAGAAAMAEQKYADAVASFDRAVALDAQITEVWVQRGDALVKLRKMEDALRSYESAQVLKADDPAACFGRARALTHLERGPEAKAAFTHYLTLQDVPGYSEGAATAARTWLARYAQKKPA